MKLQIFNVFVIKTLGGVEFFVEKSHRVLNYFLLMGLLSCPFFNLDAGRHIQDPILWKHVVTLDRLAWQEQNKSKIVNKQVDDLEFVRRLYIDITGKIPTYEQVVNYLNSKAINKRGKLIEDLLDSPGYVSNFSNFWNDLLRIPYGNITGEADYHQEFKRYIERVLAENRTYDKIVYDMLISEGSLQDNPASGFWMIDYQTSTHDTLNATVRAFLGTRIGCAQCHNHRFDKWTQKEFYESSAYLYGIGQKSDYPNNDLLNMRKHVKAFTSNPEAKKQVSYYSKHLFQPSRQRVVYNPAKKLRYPKNYVYDNAKPNAEVQERIVFGYGDEAIQDKDRRKVFATWLTSKNNPMFARIMANRLWKRIMGMALMDPIDDWKDNISIQNPNLLEAMGKIFASLNYDFKAFLSVIFNSEAYQLGYKPKNVIDQENYNLQGAKLKRMSYAQILDSLLTLQYGDLDPMMKLDPQYFEFEDKLYTLVEEYKKEFLPEMKDYTEQYGVQSDEISDKAIEILGKYFEKLKELEDYYQIDLNGRLKNDRVTKLVDAKGKSQKENKSATMMTEGSMAHLKNDKIKMAHYQNNDFMKVFGSSLRSSPETDVNTGATMKQILKLMSSDQSRAAVKENSYIMQELWKREKLADRVKFLYYSIYGRAPTGKDIGIAVKFFSKSDKKDRWSKYVLALINSPEFYFYK